MATIVLEADMRTFEVTFCKYPTHHNRKVYSRASSPEMAIKWAKWYLMVEPDTISVKEVQS